jgi:general secretion pathway protein D
LKPTSRIKSGLSAAAFVLTCSAVILSSENRVFSQSPAVQPAYAAQNPNISPKQIAGQKLYQARKALAVRDTAAAERLTAEVQSMRMQYAPNEDSPEALIALIQEYNRVIEFGKTAGNTDQFRRQYALLMVHQADSMLRFGDFNLAQQLTQEAINQRAVFNQAECNAGLEPGVLLRRIDEARRIQQLNSTRVAVQMPPQPMSLAAQEQFGKAVNVLRQAREALSAKQFDRAEQLCRAAKEYNLPENVYPPGSDTPDRLLAEVSAKRHGIAVRQLPAQGTAMPPVQPQQAAANNNPILQTAGAARPVLAPPVPNRQGASLVDQTVRNREAVVSQISSEIMQQISDAQRMSQQQRKPETGLEILQNARVRVETSALDAETKTVFIRQIDRAIEETVSFIDRYSAQSKQDQINKAVMAERRQEAEQFRSKEERLETLFRECNKLIEQQRYDEAIMVAKKAKEFAPDEQATHLLLTTTQLAYNATRSMQVRDKKADSFVDAMIGVDSASVMPDFDKSPLHYATNWSDLTKRRRATNAAAEYQRPETERQILRQLEMPVSANSDRPVPLEQALKMLCGQTGVPMYLDEAALREADIMSPETTVKVPIARDIKLKSALNTVLDQLGLAYVVKNEMLTITSKKRARGEKYLKSYYVGDLINNMPNLNPTGSNGNALEDAFIKGWQLQQQPRMSNGQTGGNAGNNGVQNDLTSANLDKFQPVSARSGQDILGQRSNSSSRSGSSGSSGYGSSSGGYGGSSGTSSIDDIIDLITEIVSPDSWEDAPEPQSFNEDKLIVTQTEEVHSKIEDLLSQLRKMNDLQVAVEVRYITLSDSFFEVMGLDFDMNFRNDKAAGKVTQTTIPGTPTTDGTTPAPIVTGTKGSSVAVGLNGPNTFSIDGSVPFFQNSFDVALSPMYGAAQPGVGLQTGFALLSDIEAYFFLAAAQGDERSSVLTAPKVMIYNGQSGTVNDTITTPYVTSVNPVVGDFSVGYQPIISMLTQGQLLTVQATVSADRQHVRMTLNPTFTKITKESTFKYFGDDEDSEESEDSTLTALGDDIASIEAGTNTGDERNAKKRKRTVKTSGITLQQPTVSSFYVQATVNCPDGGTAVLGGIKRLSEGRREAGTPILNKIPYIQRLFSNTSIGRDTKTMMMMVTPRIIIQEEEEEHIMGKSVQ